MPKLIPIYRTDGEWVAVYFDGHLFNVDGEWIGFVKGRRVYDTGGKYLAYLSDDKRLLRKRTASTKYPRLKPPLRPACPKIPSFMPLAPMLRSLPHHIIDMFEEFPEQLMYVSDTRPDME